jgi:hypothetical protein
MSEYHELDDQSLNDKTGLVLKAGDKQPSPSKILLLAGYRF